MENIIGMFTGGGGGNGFSPFSESRAQEHYQDLYLQEQPRHESSLTHEAVAAAAGFAAMHAYEAHLRATGQPVSHGKMKEIIAAIAAAEVDKLAETKGLDWLDRHRAKEAAAHQAHALAAQRYGNSQDPTGWEYASQSGGPVREYDFYGGAPFGTRGCESYGWYDQRYGAPPGGGPGYAGGGYGGGGGYGEGYGGGGYGGGYPQEQGYGGGYGQPPLQGYYEGGYEQGPPRGGYGY